jgi:hypothetical protein
MAFYPLLEFRRNVRDKKSFEEISPIEFQRKRVFASTLKRVERDSIAPENGDVNSNLFFSTRYESVFSKRSPKKMQSLAERSTCVGLIEIRPQ